jgi:MFS family permease
MGTLLIAVGGIFFIGVLAASIAAYLNDRDRRNGKGCSLIIYAVGALLAGVLACALVVPAFFVMCSGEACAWVGAIVVLPGLFALGVAIFVYFWLRHGKSPNPSFKRDALKRAP